ncbi:MAG: DUF6268 family outer membrane beta-barrel protein [Bacteroidia bacterium]|jgi:hypothetical protein|nr:DUF6268 family outer membrane beta-barrel protein [Bacteroidia bacterium]
MKKQILLLCTILLAGIAFAQQDSTQEEQIDFSQFADMGTPEGSKRYCTSKVLGLSPNKLITVAYDFQGPHQLTNIDPFGVPNNLPRTPESYVREGKADIQSSGGLRLVANVPIISNTKWLINVGGTYWRNGYQMNSFTTNNYVVSNLQQRGLTTIGLNTTIFKPLNERHFILAFASADANGDYNLSDSKIGEYLVAPKITAAAFWGWKRNDRSMLAVGFSHTYRPGAQGVIPLILFNHTFENRKWGIEALFPARAAVRRTINTRNLVLFGYELEGNSYSMINRTTGASFNPAYNNLELRRSEIRPRISYEKAITDFIWVTAQVGYRINYNFNIDQGDIFRLIGSDKPYYMENTLTNAFYFQIGINLVSP